jgi:hypothetical protein
MELTFKQQIKLQQGANERQNFKDLVSETIENPLTDSSWHLYVNGPAGIGKSHEVRAAIEGSGLPYINVSGNTTMFAFGLRLATLAHTIREGRIVVNVDDCDELLKDGANCNILKNVLEGLKVYQYEKSMTSQMSNLSPIQVEAIEAFSNPLQSGFTVPTERFQFIFTSNISLPNDDEVAKEREKNTAKAALMGHRNAIASRCSSFDLNLDEDSYFGWLADVAMNTRTLLDIGLDKDQIIILLDWLERNWPDLKERSVRSIKRLSEHMVKNPGNYRNRWESKQFLK